MTAIIAPPPRIPLLLRWGLRVAQRRTGTELLPAQLLAWYPKAAVGSAVLESLIAHRDGELDERMLKLVRMAVSFAVSCPFCVGMNSEGWERLMSEEERLAVQGLRTLEGFTEREALAIEYARLISATPLQFPPEFADRLTATFTERELVVLATTAAQVNYWARVIQSLGCPPE
jgi:alkylhydroperoxidase family enzyme